jgi:hypothetical protein
MHPPRPQATKARTFLELSTSSHKWGITWFTHPTPAGQYHALQGKPQCAWNLASCEVRQQDGGCLVSTVLLHPDAATNGGGCWALLKVVRSCGCGKGLSVLSLHPPGPHTSLCARVFLHPNCSREDTCLSTCLFVHHGSTTRASLEHY